MEAASPSETSLNFYQTTYCNIPENNHLNLKQLKKGLQYTLINALVYRQVLKYDTLFQRIAIRFLNVS